jgi:DNA-binding HxlR family transcriptional regulator
MRKTYQLPCNIAQVLNIIGDRWTLLIIRDLLNGKTMFNELRHSLEGISANILSERLRSLEAEGIVAYHLYSSHPPRYEYRLTDKGLELSHVLNAIALWGYRNLETNYSVVKHSACGHEVELSYYCPHCESNVTDIEVEMINQDESV